MDQQARILMWARRESSAISKSWELEQAFAEDDACVWPPTCYSCSFCTRQFKSAQALGGHMNVHRRDRARLLKQQSSIMNYPQTHDQLVQPQNHPGTSFGHAPIIDHSSRVSTFLHDNPNSELSPISSNVIRVSPVVGKNHENSIVLSSIMIKNEDKKSRVFEADKDDCVTKDLNLIVCGKQANDQSDDEEVASCKRKRRIEANPLSLLPKLSFKMPSGEELDLELRLGHDATKVK